MLVVTRREGEILNIFPRTANDEPLLDATGLPVVIQIMLIEGDRKKSRFGVEAPKSVKIERDELSQLLPNGSRAPAMIARA